MDNWVYGFALVVMLIAAFIFGFTVAERMEKPKLQLVKNVTCELPGEMEVLMLVVQRDDTNQLGFNCTAVRRWKVAP